VECGREGVGYLGGREDGEVRVGLPRHECPPPEHTNLAGAGNRERGRNGGAAGRRRQGESERRSTKTNDTGRGGYRTLGLCKLVQPNLSLSLSGESQSFFFDTNSLQAWLTSSFVIFSLYLGGKVNEFQEPKFLAFDTRLQEHSKAFCSNFNAYQKHVSSNLS
jgi:hypothetical protein